MQKNSSQSGKICRLSYFLDAEGKNPMNEATFQPSNTRKVALAVVLTALSVILGSLSIPVGVTKVAPAQHMINAVGGVLLGPWYAVVMAVVTATIRMGLGTGTIFAYPGSIFGGLVVGLVYKYIKKSDYVALLEPLGTVVIGATLSALVVAPIAGKSMTLEFFWIAFAASCIPGSILGFIVLKALRRAGFDRYLV